MKTTTLNISISDEMYSTLELAGHNKVKLEKNARENLAINLYSEGVLSFGQASELAHMNKWAFMELLRERKIPFYEPTAEEISGEYKLMDKMFKRLKDESSK